MYTYIKFNDVTQLQQVRINNAEPFSQERIEEEGWVFIENPDETGLLYKLVDGEPTIVSLEDMPREILRSTWDVRMQDLRTRRNMLLQSCDWTQLPDVAPEVSQAWQTYRQQLRDITETVTREDDPNLVELPTPPTL